MACRFPGADSPEAFWDNLRAGVESITTLSEAELLALFAEAYPPVAPVDRARERRAAQRARLIERQLAALAYLEPLLVQPIGFADSSLQVLADLVDSAGRELGHSLVLERGRGDIVLADRNFIQQVVPQVLNAFIEDRPLVTLELPLIDALDPLRRASRAHVELVRQLRNLPEGLASAASMSARPPSSGFDSGFDSRAHVEQLVQTDLDPDRAQLLNALRRGLVDPAEAPLTAGFGPGELVLSSAVEHDDPRHLPGNTACWISIAPTV